MFPAIGSAGEGVIASMIRGTRTRIGIALVAALATAGIAAGCGGSSSEGGKLDLNQEGTLTVGSDIPYPPFEQGHAPNYTGFDIDLIDAIAKQLNLKPKIVDTGFGTIFADEQAGKFDIVASATSITKARQKRVTFSDPYFDADQSLMVQKGSSLQSTKDITSSTTIGAQQGTTGQDYAEKETDAQVQKYPEIGNAFNALQAGQVDGVINDFAVSAFALKKYPQLDVVQSIPTGEKYGFPMQQTDTELQDAVNGALKDLIADGTYQKIFQKWFQKPPPKEFQPSS
jgi:polar amino acid transport system substrate-binding protein